jgi:predicted RNA-binding Zn-ribbon protein involved in translation (DUF1610 family)
MSEILRLYSGLARGVCDDDLVNEVAFAFYARCQSIIEVMEAGGGTVRCHGCGEIIRRSTDSEELIQCEQCGWSITWKEFFKSYQKRQLHGGSAYPFFREYVARLPKCKTVDEKVLLIDWIIHQCHIAVNPKISDPVARPAAVNLIEATVTQVIPFLENLPMAPKPEMQEAYRQWKAVMAASLRPI